MINVVDKIYAAYEEGRKLKEKDNITTSVEDDLINTSNDDRSNNAKSVNSINWTYNDIKNIVDSNDKAETEFVPEVEYDDNGDGMFECESNDEDVALDDSDTDENIHVVNMDKDIRYRLFIHNKEREIDLEEGL